MSHDPMVFGAHDSTAKAFHRARWQARVEQIWTRLTGRSADLLCYLEVRDLLMPKASHSLGHREIPLAAVVGSVERCADYTRSFLPLKDSDQRRWVGVRRAFVQSRPLPPIQVYQVGEVYFVADGNHRVSVARQLGGGTEADLYLALSEHRIALEEAVGQDVGVELVAVDLARQPSSRVPPAAVRAARRLWDALSAGLTRSRCRRRY